ncbi:MAG: hypothetical protein JWP66_1288 [Naasia sp.]|nr:hypothetical protein [Naasia sp.]
MTLFRDADTARPQSAEDDSVVLNVQVRVTPSEDLRDGLPTSQGVVKMSEPEAVATAVAVAVADAPFEENHVPLENAEISLGAVTVSTAGPERLG